ncbi:hypothetical protein EHV15_35625 [Paenibacillus oralis]|uniref:Uncharacterized protein n=1 Tax=Paenibacillus oralis TaxID=2490856 RepID=A0A3P3TBK1_9BACL|nr:hypothetical protein [Paenibacillus oralis]RRJ54904.1 hypothetical protein EHV15_35625 [Paenibacillus oralis]
MKNIQSILKQWASDVLEQTKNFDIEECVTVQYGDTPHWERFFKEMRESRGWDKVRMEFRLKTTEQAHFKMIDLLNQEIEIQYIARVQAVLPPKECSSLEEGIPACS